MSKSVWFEIKSDSVGGTPVPLQLFFSVPVFLRSSTKVPVLKTGAGCVAFNNAFHFSTFYQHLTKENITYMISKFE